MGEKNEKGKPKTGAGSADYSQSSNSDRRAVTIIKKSNTIQRLEPGPVRPPNRDQSSVPKGSEGGKGK